MGTPAQDPNTTPPVLPNRQWVNFADGLGCLCGAAAVALLLWAGGCGRWG